MSTTVTNNEAASRYEVTAAHPDQYLALVPADRRSAFGPPAA
jgi:hypothetical protein